MIGWPLDWQERFAALIAPINRRLAEVGGAFLDAAVLTRRAELLGLPAGSDVSPNGSCHILRALDDWVAINLPRSEDVALLPALLCTEDLEKPAALASAVAAVPAGQLVDRATLLGLPLARLDEADDRPAAVKTRLSARAEAGRTPLVVDLSSLWAGPLCSAILRDLGARVVKVESITRPDGARTGNPAFFDLLNRGKTKRQIDFASAEGRDALVRLIDAADIVIEASRPRAMRQLGIDAAELVRARPGKVWLSITAYGREEPMGMRCGFGDDAAFAGGLVRRDVAGVPQFAGDALADPLAGLAGARAVLAARRDGFGVLIDLSMANAAAEIARG